MQQFYIHNSVVIEDFEWVKVDLKVKRHKWRNALLLYIMYILYYVVYNYGPIWCKLFAIYIMFKCKLFLYNSASMFCYVLLYDYIAYWRVLEKQILINIYILICILRLCVRIKCGSCLACVLIVYVCLQRFCSCWTWINRLYVDIV